eukprot:1608513-Alexandrium_andersonii.AAC.1
MWHECPRLAPARTDTMLCAPEFVQLLPPLLREHGVAVVPSVGMHVPFWGGEALHVPNPLVGAQGYRTAREQLAVETAVERHGNLNLRRLLTLTKGVEPGVDIHQ